MAPLRLRCSIALLIAAWLAGCSETAPSSAGAGMGTAARGGVAAGGSGALGAGMAGVPSSAAGSAGSASGGNATGGAATAGAGAGGGGAAGGSAPSDPSFILGADVSWLLEDEAAGATYYDGEVKLDLLELLRARGFNYIRIRSFVDPAAAGGYAAGKSEAWCDVEHTIELAQRVRQLGMGILLDFHYSDDWADPSNQAKPAAWASLPFAELVQALHDYTFDTISALAAAGVKPDMVQIGNEITPGMLFPDGESSNENWPRLGQLLKAGASAVQEVDPNIRIMLHIEKGGDNATTRWWVDHAIAEDVPFQILGQSCYTQYQGTPDQWQANFEDLVTRYPDHRFVIAEYSQEKRRVSDIMRGLPEQRGLGSFIWEPTRWMEAVFDRNGQRYDANELLDVYSQIATDYGLLP